MERIRWMWLLLVVFVSTQRTVCNLPEQNVSNTNDTNNTNSTHLNHTFETELRNNCSGQNVIVYSNELGFFFLILLVCDVISSTFVQAQGHTNFFV